MFVANIGLFKSSDQAIMFMTLLDIVRLCNEKSPWKKKRKEKSSLAVP